MEPFAPQLARANKKYKCAIDLMYAYAHTPLYGETIKLTSFSSGDKLFAFIRGFYGLKGLLNFFKKQMSSFFKTLIEQGFALVYIDDIFYQILKNLCFSILNNYLLLVQKKILKLASNNPFSCFSKSNFWDMK